jgi:hypothetical protein
MSSTAVATTVDENPVRRMVPNNSLANIRANARFAEVGTYRQIREMNMSGQSARRALLAERLYDLVRVSGGAQDRMVALGLVADSLGTTVDEARHGINTAMGAGLLVYSADGLQLLIP